MLFSNCKFVKLYGFVCQKCQIVQIFAIDFANLSVLSHLVFFGDFRLSCIFVCNIYVMQIFRYFPIIFYFLNHNPSIFSLTLQSSKGTMRKPSG